MADKDELSEKAIERWIKGAYTGADEGPAHRKVGEK